MSRSISSVLIVVLSIIAALSGGWMYMHSKAQNKPVKTPFDHPFLKIAHQSSRPILLYRIQSPAEISPEANFEQAAKHSPNLGYWLDVRLTGDGSLFVSHEERLRSGPATGKPIELATSEECRAAGLHELIRFSDSIQNRPVVLNLISRRPGLAARLLEIWGPEKKPIPLQSTVAQSESDGTIKELRESQPRGLYGSSQAALIQLEILSSLDLQGLAELKSDLLISDLEERIPDEATGEARFRPRVRPATLSEAKRRGLRRYAGPTSDLATVESLFTDGYDGVLTDSKEIVRHFFPTAFKEESTTH